MPLLSADRLRKSYPKASGAVDVLCDVDFSLDESEAVAIVGPSGSGKSTFLNLVGGLDRPDGGELRYEGTKLDLSNGRDMTRWRNRTVGFVFQFHFLLPDFTALENLLIPVHMDHVPGPADTTRARDLLAELGLGEREDHLPGELSGGEQQRVAVARAFMNRPRIVLLDEPFGNLDHEKGRQLGELLFALRERERTALVIVTHDLSLADRADRVLRLEGCRLVPEVGS
jgi:predicted ABC-type transport system involved in lysophospholipase L1 biosynthesis ATPase subunit